MKQTLLRYESDRLSDEVKKYAKVHHQSVNHTLNRILAHFFGLKEGQGKKQYTDLDALWGSWSKEEEKQFKKSVSAFEKVDAEFWGHSK